MDSIDFRIERSILKTGSRINNIRDNDLRVRNLSSAQSETILYYADHAGDSIRNLAEHLQVTHQAARKLVDKLRKKEVLDVRESEEDRRCARVFLTNTGVKLCRDLKDGGALTGESLLTGFSEKEKEQLADFLSRIEKNIRCPRQKPL